MSLINDAKQAVKDMLGHADDAPCGGDEYWYPDDFDDYSDFDSTLINSKEGAPE